MNSRQTLDLIPGFVDIVRQGWLSLGDQLGVERRRRQPAFILIDLALEVAHACLLGSSLIIDFLAAALDEAGRLGDLVLIRVGRLVDLFQVFGIIIREHFGSVAVHVDGLWWQTWQLLN